MSNILFVFINDRTNDHEFITAGSINNAWKLLRKDHRYERFWRLSGGIQ